MVSAMTHWSLVEGLEQPRIACDDSSGDDIRIAKLDYMPTVAVDRRRSRTVLAETGSGGAAGRRCYASDGRYGPGDGQHRPDHCDGALAIGKLAIPTGMRLEDTQLAAGKRTLRILLATVLLLKFRWPNRSQRKGSQTFRLDGVDRRCLRQLMDEECPNGSPSGGFTASL